METPYAKWSVRRVSPRGSIAVLSVGTAIEHGHDGPQDSEHGESTSSVYFWNCSSATVPAAITKSQKAKGKRVLSPQCRRQEDAGCSELPIHGFLQYLRRNAAAYDRMRT